MNTNIAAAMTPQGIDGYIAFYEGVRIDLQTHKADEGIDAAGKLELTRSRTRLKGRILQMEIMNCSAADIHKAASDGIQEILQLASTFKSKTAATDHKAAQVYAQISTTESDIHGTTFSADNFTPPKPTARVSPLAFPLKREGGAATTQQIFFCSPGYLEQRENIQEIMSIVTGVASVVGYVNKGIASVIVETKDNISRHAHAICNKNELIQKRCQQILSLPGRAANALTSLNGAMESIGQRAEKKITQFCNQNPGNKKLCHRAGIFFQSMACAIEQSELPVQPQVYLQLLNKTSNSTALSDMAHTVDSQWNLRLGTTQDFLSNATLVAMSMNFPGKGSSLFTQWVKSIPAKLKASVKFESRLSTQQLVYTSKAAEAKAVEAEVKAIASNLKYADNPTYKRRFGESQKVEALKVKALEHKKANGLIGLEQRVAHQQTLAHGYKQDRILLSQLAKEQPLQLPEQLRQALQQPEFISRMQYTSSSLLRARIGDNNVHYILHVYSKSSIASALQHTSSHSGRNFLAFDPQTHALQDVHAALGGLSKTVVGVGKLPRGEFTPFIVIEIK